jgi:hypothetical protein
VLRRRMATPRVKDTAGGAGLLHPAQATL